MSHAKRLTEGQKRRIMVGVMMAMMLAALDQTIVAPALPIIGASLGDSEFLSWIVSAYLVTGTAVTPLYGKFSDIHGRRPALFVSLGVFLLGSVICALAPSMTAIILGRAAQGLGGGGLLALAQTVVADIAAPRERARYVVYFSLVWATSSVAGPIVGGFFAQHLTWSLIFWINLPIGALAVLMTNNALRILPQVKRDHRLDLAGSVLMIGATTALMLVLTLGGVSYPWSSTPILLLAVAAAILCGGLIVDLALAKEPLIPLSIFRNEVVGSASLSMFFAMVAFVGSTVYLPIYLEFALGMAPTESGAGLIVLLAGSVLGANTTGRYMPRIVHYKRMAIVGLSLAVAGSAALSLLAPHLVFWQVEALMLAVGVGVGAVFPTLTVSVQNAVDPRDLGIGTATLGFLRSLGGALGVAALGAVVLAHGVVTDRGLARAGAAFDPDLAKRAGEAFVGVFALQAAALALSLGCLLLMEERPLRGPAQNPIAAE
ncbi:MAG TPA: MDR family MFS transporter [Roseiarcus sp.]|nr:MDR family MFS transporter [Roseiarcus sp.]